MIQKLEAKMKKTMNKNIPNWKKIQLKLTTEKKWNSEIMMSFIVLTLFLRTNIDNSIQMFKWNKMAEY